MPGASLRIRLKDARRVSKYAFGTGTARFHVCIDCGVVPVVTSEIDGRLFAVVSVNVLEGLDPSLVARAASNFDGEAIEDRLARRKKHWISDVKFEQG